MRSRTSSQKRQKEIARMEKQREKAARRLQRNLERKRPGVHIDHLASESNAAETELAAGSE